MAYEICDKIKNMTPYEPISGNYPIRLDANESFLQPDEGLQMKLLEAVAGVPMNRYPEALAADVCAAFAKRYRAQPECVVAGNGSDELISVIIGCMLQKGEPLLTLAPDFSMYRFYGELQELNLVTLQKREDLTISAKEIIKAAKEARAKAIIFSNPCNPTSLVMDANDVLEIARQTDALVIVDEAYMDFCDQSILCKVSELDNVIVLKTCSKAMGAAALRLGFAVTNSKIANALRAAKSPYNTDAFSQAMGTVLLGEDEYLDNCILSIKRSRDVLYDGLTRLAEFKKNKIIKVFKPQTNFVLIEMDNAKACFDALLAIGIVVRHMGNFLRITAGTDVENASVLSALAKLL